MKNNNKDLPPKFFKVGKRIEHSKFLIFNTSRKKEANLPTDMYRDILMVLGCDESYKRYFTRNYSQLLAKHGQKILYISDSKCSPGYLEENPSQFKLTSDEINSASTSFKLGDSQVNDILKVGSPISFIEFSESVIDYFTEEQVITYNEKLMSFLEGITESNHSDLSEYVLFMEESFLRSKHSNPDIDAMILKIRDLGVGVVLCCGDIDKYKTVAKQSRHSALFKLSDPLYNLDALGYGSMIINGHFGERMSSRDFKSIPSSSFYHFDRDNFQFQREIELIIK